MAIHEILFPTDFSDAAHYAGRYAALLARKLGASLHVLHVPPVVAPPSPLIITGLDFAELQRQGRLEAEARLQKLLVGEEYRGLNVKMTVAGVMVEDEILAAAEESDLIVMGTHGRTGLSRTLLGSVTEKVVGTAPCPVLAVKHPEVTTELPWGGKVTGRRKLEQTPRLLNILVPLDGSPLAEGVLGDAIPLARAFEAVVILFLVVASSLRLGGKARDAGSADEQAEADQYLQMKLQGLKAEGLMAEAAIRTGDAATEILDYADERGVDLIVMRTHGDSGLRRWLLGSVAEKVLRGADIPVLMYRAWTRKK